MNFIQTLAESFKIYHLAGDWKKMLEISAAAESLGLTDKLIAAIEA